MTQPAQRIVLPRAVDKNGEPIKGVNREASVARLAAFAAALPLDKGWALEVTEARRRRSTEQNAYLWGVVYATLEKETGQEAEDWHNYWLGEFFGWEKVELFGRSKIKPKRRSSRLTTVEFADYVDFIARKCAEQGIYIPEPNEMLKVAA